MSSPIQVKSEFLVKLRHRAKPARLPLKLQLRKFRCVALSDVKDQQLTRRPRTIILAATKCLARSPDSEIFALRERGALTTPPEVPHHGPNL